MPQALSKKSRGPEAAANWKLFWGSDPDPEDATALAQPKGGYTGARRALIDVEPEGTAAAAAGACTDLTGRHKRAGGELEAAEPANCKLARLGSVNPVRAKVSKAAAAKTAAAAQPTPELSEPAAAAESSEADDEEEHGASTALETAEMQIQPPPGKVWFRGDMHMRLSDVLY